MKHNIHRDCFYTFTHIQHMLNLFNSFVNKFDHERDDFKFK